LPRDGCIELRRHFVVIDVIEVSNPEGFFSRNPQEHIVEIAAFRAKDLKVVLRHPGAPRLIARGRARGLISRLRGGLQ
jgi:hypothetical protein